jgi:hypothetical protein
MSRIFSLSLLVLAASLIAAPAAVAATAPAPPAAASADSVYCVYLGPAGVGSTQLYPGGKYCVPGP